jgi:hypothetical protein
MYQKDFVLKEIGIQTPGIKLLVMATPEIVLKTPFLISVIINTITEQIMK